MGKAKITFAVSAVEDLEEIRRWYAKQQAPEVGAKMIGEILTRLEKAAEFPRSGRVVPELGSEDIREVIHPPFRVVYRVEQDEIRVVRVWHSERLLRIPT